MTIFLSIFLAELGDKTQLATLLYSSATPKSPWLVFLAASSALVASTGIAVAVGQAAHSQLAAWPTKLIAGVGFVLIGAWMILTHFRAG
ncbi:MAG: TMEM165/GDT1 family protein [Alphaproteobacteria bacterium]